MSLIRLTIRGISDSRMKSGAYALVLGEIKGSRTLSIIIGAFEAQSIVIALEKEIRSPRPLTHDLFKSFADRYFITIKQVIIHRLIDGVFFSSLICERNGVEEVIDARTSDAIALAVRFDAPIYTYENILNKAGVYLKIVERPSTQRTKPDEDDALYKIIPNPSENVHKEKTLKQLHKELENAVDSEDYELAAKIRDEIGKRS